MKSIRIGTRNSPLALWQAHEVAQHLQKLDVNSEIVPIVSTGDKNLDQPLYTMGITGVFTKDLDIALLRSEIDIAVHSLKDVPTRLPENIELAAFLPRDYPQDVLVRRKGAERLPLNELKIATGSLRRCAFWLKELPGTEFTGIRGNVNTRLKKIEEGLADATIFSLAGLQRLNLGIPYEELPFMLPAPAQGVVAVACRADDAAVKEILPKINHTDTQICVETERHFLQKLEGGCTAPIGAFAEIMDGKMRFVGRLCSLDGQSCLETDDIVPLDDPEILGSRFADAILNNGGREIMAEINRQL